MSGFYQWQGEDLILHCHLQPNASCDSFSGEHNQRLKIRISAPPIDGKANAQLSKFLSKAFGVAKSQVVLKRGDSSRQKTLRILAPNKIPDSLPIKRP